MYFSLEYYSNSKKLCFVQKHFKLTSSITTLTSLLFFNKVKMMVWKKHAQTSSYLFAFIKFFSLMYYFLKSNFISLMTDSYVRVIFLTRLSSHGLINLLLINITSHSSEINLTSWFSFTKGKMQNFLVQVPIRKSVGNWLLFLSCGSFYGVKRLCTVYVVFWLV